MSKKKKQEMKEPPTNRNILWITYAIVLLFLGLAVYIGYFLRFQGPEVINNSYNARLDSFADRVHRGRILAADGTVLAHNEEDEDGNEIRVYDHGDVFAHVVGYSTKGKTGIEALANFYLLTSHVNLIEQAGNELAGKKNLGDDAVTTLDMDLQQAAYSALGDRRGAVIAMEPGTGKILAMVSKPDFDPNTIADDWDTFVSDDSDSSVLLNRATQGQYPPGSTFKIFTTLEYIHENADYADYHFDCSGEYTVGTKTIHCHNNKRHGSEDLKTSFANSCNSSYASLGLTLDLEQFDDLCDQMLFNTALPTDFESSKSSFVLEPGDSDSAVMETSIGQGKTLVTPFHMALIASAIANDGVLMKPYVIDRITDAEGEVVEQYEPAEYKTLLSESDASVLQEYMRYVVEEGTATKLKSDSYEAAGKTGSAEFSSSSDATHSWFVGYAHSGEEPDIAVAVIVENSGVGSEYAVPIAKQIFDAYYTWEN